MYVCIISDEYECYHYYIFIRCYYMADLCLPTILQLSLNINITFGEKFIRVVI